MGSSKNIQLLKEYIKTLIATQVVFPRILPRQWGTEFSHSERNAMYVGLQYVLKQAHPLRERAMLNAFERIDASAALDLHWFLSDYWREVIVLLERYPNLDEGYLARTNLRT